MDLYGGVNILVLEDLRASMSPFILQVNCIRIIKLILMNFGIDLLFEGPLIVPFPKDDFSICYKYTVYSEISTPSNISKSNISLPSSLMGKIKTDLELKAASIFLGRIIMSSRWKICLYSVKITWYIQYTRW